MEYVIHLNMNCLVTRRMNIAFELKAIPRVKSRKRTKKRRNVSLCNLW